MYLKTSIFSSPARTLVCPVNCCGVMGAGLALEFHRRFPGLLADFRRMRFEIGKVGFWESDERVERWKIVCLFPTKDDWRTRSELWMIEAGLKMLTERYLPTWPEDSHGIAFPKLGCGLGGLNWPRDVQPLMERYLADLPFPVYVHV